MLPSKHIAYLIGPPSFAKQIHSDEDLISKVEKGLKTSAIKHLAANIHLPEPLLQSLLHIPERTMGRRKESGYLSYQESDRLIILAQVVAHALEVFGSPEKANDWFQSENHALGNKIPLSLLGSTLGCLKVIEVVNRIRYGIYS